MKFTNTLKIFVIMLLASVIIYPTCPYRDHYGYHTINECENYHEVAETLEGVTGGGGLWFD